MMIEFKPKDSGGRSFLIVLFAIWGMGGLAVTTLVGAAAPTLSAVFAVLFWIGGMMLFGVGSLLAGPSFRSLEPSFPVHVVKSTITQSFEREYNGIAYDVLQNNFVVGAFPDGQLTFTSWKDFVDAASRVPNDRD
jgi:hypothetical protein